MQSWMTRDDSEEAAPGVADEAFDVGPGAGRLANCAFACVFVIALTHAFVAGAIERG
jgi:hypothetical protein